MPNRFNTFTISMMVLTFAIGFFVNYWSTKLANDKLLASLQGQYDAILQAQQTGRGAQSPAIENKKIELRSQIELLSNK